MTPRFQTVPSRLILDDKGPGPRQSWCFENPTDVIACWQPEGFTDALATMEKARGHGFHLAGFISYEAGYLLEPKLTPLLPEARDFPLLWFGLYRQRRALSAKDLATLFPMPSTGLKLGPLIPEITPEAYKANIEKLGELIKSGDIYQANYTYRAKFDVLGNPVDLYGLLRQLQPVSYGAFIEAEDWALLSCSPELFLKNQGGILTSKPMKGTAARGLTSEADELQKSNLKSDPKQRSENLMILDLIRNDLSRVCLPGSVKVPSAFDVETYRTLHQMTSTVAGRLQEGLGPIDVLAALFPCGSVTGTPKVRAMEVIADLEKSPRGPYTGAIGMISPDGDYEFNVAIRTMTLEKQAGQVWAGTIGVGGGIINGSTPEGEWAECQTKLAFLRQAQNFKPEPAFQLIETIGWTKQDGFKLLQAHMARLAASAIYFDFQCDIPSIRAALVAKTDNFTADHYMVRLLLSEDGSYIITEKPFPAPTDVPWTAPWTFAISEYKVDSQNPFQYHKTTRRQLYDQEHAHLSAETGCNEVLFVNERGELTEGSRTNIFLKKGTQLLTPRLSSGLLNGTLRRHLLDDPATEITEQVLTLADLAKADQVLLGNSVRGLVPAIPVQASG